jgi:hypothetical protein
MTDFLLGGALQKQILDQRYLIQDFKPSDRSLRDPLAFFTLIGAL